VPEVLDIAAAMSEEPPSRSYQWRPASSVYSGRMKPQQSGRLFDAPTEENLEPSSSQNSADESQKRVASVSPRNQLNDLTGRDWIVETKSVWFQKGLGAGHAHAEIERLHPAPFSFQDISRIVRFFTKEGGRVLDPFLGVGSTLKACAVSRRKGVGIELMPTWADLARLRLEREVDDVEARFAAQEILCGDARDLLPTLKAKAFDLVVTSPPYWRILNKIPDHKVLSDRVARGLATSYGEDLRDLGNIESYDRFLDELVGVFAQCERVVCDGGHLAIIVGDFREGSRFIPFHADLCLRIPAGSKWVLQAVNVLVQNQKRLYPYGYPSAYVPNLHHQHILIFRKPKARKSGRRATSTRD
jgi:DNA modification methylase